MFGLSKYMHIANADDDEVAAFEAHKINEVVACCGVRIARGGLFGRGGAMPWAKVCEPCALIANWDWDEDIQDWVAPHDYEDAGR